MGPLGGVFIFKVIDRVGNALNINKYYYTGGRLNSPDLTAPSIPSGLNATMLSASEVKLTWNASTDTSGYVNYEGYRNGFYIGKTAQNELE